MHQKFAERLGACGLDREKLITLMHEIDAEKRALKSYLSQISSEPDGEFGRGRARQVQIRKLRSKQSFLIEEREVVRLKLKSLNTDKKALNKSVNNRSPEFSQAFLAACEQLLDEEQFVELEMKAAQILISKKGQV